LCHVVFGSGLRRRLDATVGAVEMQVMARDLVAITTLEKQSTLRSEFVGKNHLQCKQLWN
jgi:hypothetical protein